jgi:hypothetical protein
LVASREIAYFLLGAKLEPLFELRSVCLVDFLELGDEVNVLFNCPGLVEIRFGWYVGDVFF